MTNPIPGAGVSFFRPAPKQVIARQIQNTLRRIPRELLRALDLQELVEALKQYHGIPKHKSAQTLPRSGPSSPSSSSLRQYSDQGDQVTTEWLNWLSGGRAGFWDYWKDGEAMALKPFLEWVQTPPEVPVGSGVGDVGCGLGRLAPNLAVAAARRGEALTMVEPDDYRRGIAERLMESLEVVDVRVMPSLSAGSDPEMGYSGLLSNHVLQHTPDAEEHVDDMSRRLAPGGRLAVTTSNGGSREDIYTINRMVHTAVRQEPYIFVQQRVTPEEWRAAARKPTPGTLPNRHFSPESLERVVTSSGLRIVSRQYFHVLEEKGRSSISGGKNLEAWKREQMYQSAGIEHRGVDVMIVAEKPHRRASPASDVSEFT